MLTQDSQSHLGILSRAIGAGHITEILAVILTSHFGEPQICATEYIYAIDIRFCGEEAQLQP